MIATVYMLVSRDQHERTPRLEDFFWTGSGDGPPPPPDPPLPTPAKPTAPYVHTTTVLATVYLDSYPPQVKGICIKENEYYRAGYSC